MHKLSSLIFLEPCHNVSLELKKENNGSVDTLYNTIGNVEVKAMQKSILQENVQQLIDKDIYQKFQTLPFTLNQWPSSYDKSFYFMSLN